VDILKHEMLQFGLVILPQNHGGVVGTAASDTGEPIEQTGSQSVTVGYELKQDCSVTSRPLAFGKKQNCHDTWVWM